MTEELLILLKHITETQQELIDAVEDLADVERPGRASRLADLRSRLATRRQELQQGHDAVRRIVG